MATPQKREDQIDLLLFCSQKLKYTRDASPTIYKKTNENGRAKQILPNKGYHIDTDKIRDTCRGQIKTYPKSSERLKTNTPEGKT